MAKSSAPHGFSDSCITCSNKYNRVRPSLCQCKHCSNSFCFDCMKDHNDELQQNIAQVSNHYNELKLLINIKQKLITDETIKSKQQISEWLRKYIENLTAEKARIDKDIENVERDAQKIVRDIEVQSQTLSSDIEGFTKTSTFQSTHMENLLEKLDEFIQRISSLSATRDYDLPSTMPKYKFGFAYGTKAAADENAQRWKTTEKPKDEEENQADIFVANTQLYWGGGSNASFSDDNNFDDREKHEPTSYAINCMASDGINIMYSTIEDPVHDIIAYCYLDVNNGNYRQEDPYRLWLLSPIVDMIWWKSLGRFVCGTANGICTVEYINRRFKILTVINNRWTDVRIAANTNFLWIHEQGKIMIYDVNFNLLRAVDFEMPCIILRESFCVTDNIVAFLIIRADRTNPNILQIQFFDCNMIKLRSFDLGSANASCMVRTNGADRFFIAAGKDVYYSMSSKGGKRAITLDQEANCLAVLNSRTIIFTKSRSEIELVKC